MKWHRYNQDDDPNKFDFESQRWSTVLPGDVVQSRGTIAYKLRDFPGRNSETKILRLHSSPVLVISRHNGVPDEADMDDWLTFVCLSRHGLIVVLTCPSAYNDQV